MKKYLTLLMIPLVFLGAFATAAYASTGAAPTIESGLNELADMAYAGFKAGEYGEMSMVLLILTVALLRKFGSSVWEPLGTRHAARLYLLVAAAAGYMYVNGVELGNLWDAFKVAAMTGGAVNIVQWAAEWLVVRSWVPGWARAALTAVLWIFRPRGADQIKAAEKAGENAVEADPPKGLGKVDRIP